MSFNKLFYNFAGEINSINMKKDISIGEIVAMDFRAASIFKEAGIDFCCGGKMGLEEACKEKGAEYVLKSLPELVYYTGKIASVHGEKHPELTEVASLFEEINRELLQHMKNEEEVLFQAIKEYLGLRSRESMDVIINQINKLSAEHEFAGCAMDKINSITSN